MICVESAIESIRDAAIFPTGWPAALDAVGHAFKSDGATLVLKSASIRSIAVSGSIQPFISPYFSGSIHDPREKRVKPTLNDGFMPDHAYFSKTEIAHEPFYQEFLKSCGFGWNATAALSDDLVLSIKRSFRSGPYDDTDLHTMNSALPWLRSVSRTAQIMWSSNFTGQLSAFDRLKVGALLLDARGRVLQSNACARFGDGLDVVDGYLQAHAAADQTRLRKFLGTIIAPGSKVAGPACIALPRRLPGRPWLVDAIASTDALRSLHSKVAALVLITDLDARPHPRFSVLRDLFDLSTTELKLADYLATGQSLRESATALSITEGHARQRLKSVFQKTGVSRQSELIALMDKIS